MKEELIKKINNLNSCIVTESRAGGGAGSIILMGLEDNEKKVYTLWIECAWRIENENKVLATSADDIEPVTGLIAKSVKMFDGKIIEYIEINAFYDLCIKFTDGFFLRVFCVFSYSCEYDVNWRLSIPEQNLSYEITNHFTVKKGTYN